MDYSKSILVDCNKFIRKYTTLGGTIMSPIMNKVLKLLLLAVVGLISLEIIFRSTVFIGDTVKKHKINEDLIKRDQRIEAKLKKQSEANKITQQVDKTFLFTRIFKFINLLNGKNGSDFQAAYDLLDPVFKNLYCKDIKAFSDYAKKYYISPTGKSVNVESYEQVAPNTYLCSVSFKDIDPESLYHNPVVQEYITVKVIDDKNFTLSLRSLLYAKNINNSGAIGNVKITVKKIIRLQDKAILNVEVVNTEQQPAILAQTNLSDIKLYGITQNGIKMGSALNFGTQKLSPNDFTVFPRSTAVLNLTFDVRSSDIISGLYFNNISVGQEKKFADIKIN